MEIRMSHNYKSPAASMSSTRTSSFFMIMAILVYLDIIGLALDYYLGLGYVAKCLQWIKENVFF
jgi:hypothetical protein